MPLVELESLKSVEKRTALLAMADYVGELAEAVDRVGQSNRPEFGLTAACVDLVDLPLCLVRAFTGEINPAAVPRDAGITRGDQSHMTLPVGLSLLQGRYQTSWNVLMAGSVLTIAPATSALSASNSSSERAPRLGAMRIT